MLFACNSQQETELVSDPVAFEKSDECHVCGMVITRFEGPKGQAFVKRDQQVKKFCSTTEMLFWYLQPENRPNVAKIYVHDMAVAPWDKPDDTRLISARDAFYVVGSSLHGSMGKTLASFQSSTDAAKFSEKYGGQVITFNGLTLELLGS